MTRPSVSLVQRLHSPVVFHISVTRWLSRQIAQLHHVLRVRWYNNELELPYVDFERNAYCGVRSAVISDTLSRVQPGNGWVSNAIIPPPLTSPGNYWYRLKSKLVSLSCGTDERDGLTFRDQKLDTQEYKIIRHHGVLSLRQLDSANNCSALTVMRPVSEHMLQGKMPQW